VSLDVITAVEIDANGRLLVKPGSERFPYIYREAMEVGWDAKGEFLFSPRPREWSYFDWFRQILEAAQAQGCTLRVSDATRWDNVPADLVAQMKAHAGEMWTA
jgi:hypothetical protein